MSTSAQTPDPKPRAYENLSRAPVVEAVLEIRCRAVDALWDEQKITAELAKRLPDYPDQTAHRPTGVPIRFSFQFGNASPVDVPAQGQPETPPWMGVRATNGKNLTASFFLDRFYFSRLTPYSSWDEFSTEALRLWAIHRELTGVEVVERIGVRFVNRIEVPRKAEPVDLSDYFVGVGDRTMPHPVTSFLFRLGYAVKDEPYGVSVVRAINPPPLPPTLATILIVDVDAFCHVPTGPGSDTIHGHLIRLRQLKNEGFFSSLSERAIALCR